MYTDEGRLLELEEPLHLDVFRQKHLIVNGVSLTLKLWPNKNAFRLMSGDEGAAYAVQILDASFKLCLQKPNAGVLMANCKLLANGTAMHPYVSTSFKVASLSKGEYSTQREQPVPGRRPLATDCGTRQQRSLQWKL
jgi:hypothetical protein